MKNGLALEREKIGGKIEKVLYQLIGSATGILRTPIGILQRWEADKDMQDHAESLSLHDAEVVQLAGKLFVHNNDDILE